MTKEQLNRRWNKLDQWYTSQSWKEQQKKIESLFPENDWKKIWKHFNIITRSYEKFNLYEWDIQQEILNHLILHK